MPISPRLLPFLALIVALGTGCATPTPSTHITLAFDRTGSFASIGAPGFNGAQLAIEQDAADGTPTVAATLIDTASTPSIARAVGGNARDTRTSAIGGLGDNDQFLALARTLGGTGIPLVSAGATDPRIPETINTPVFFACFTDNVQAAAMVQYGMQKFGPRCILIFDATSDYTLGLATYTQDALVARGGALVVQLAYSDIVGFNKAVQDAASRVNEADFVMLAALPDRCGFRIRALRDAGVALPILGGDSFDTPEILSADAPMSDVFYASHAWLGQGCTPRAQAFVDAYTKRFGVTPTSFAGLGYDATCLLIDANARRNGATLAQAIGQTTHFEGVTGTISYANGPLPLKQVWIIGVDDGRASLADAFTPTVGAHNR